MLRVDLRPVNFQSSLRESLRWGFDFTKPLKSTPPSPAAIAALRERFSGARPPGAGAVATPNAGERRFGGGGGGGRFGRGGNGGRLTLSMTHTLNLIDQVSIAEGVEDLDYLDGEALGSTGGRARHEVEVEAGYFNNALGARLSADWRGAPHVDSGSAGGGVRFSPFAKVDLRLFANLGERFELVARHPWLRGTSVRFDIDNLFNARPRVRDGNRATPLSYQPDLLDPTGRTVGITLRKLFIPRRYFRGGGANGANRRP